MINRDYTKSFLAKLLGGHFGYSQEYMMYFGSFRLNDKSLDQRLGVDAHGVVTTLFPTRQSNVVPSGPTTHDFYLDQQKASSSQNQRTTQEGYYTGEFNRRPGIVRSLGIANYYIGDPAFQDVLSKQTICSDLESGVFVFGAPDNPYGFGDPVSVESVIIPRVQFNSPANTRSPRLLDIINEFASNESFSYRCTNALMWHAGLQTLDFKMAIDYSDMEYDPTLPVPYLVAAVNQGIYYDYASGNDYGHRKLRISDSSGGATFNPNTAYVAVVSANHFAAMPVFMCGAVSKSQGVSQPHKASKLVDSFYFVGFDPTTEITAQALARQTTTRRIVIVPQSTGTPDENTYTIEVGAKYLINWTLVHHLPGMDAKSRPSRYFTEQGTFLLGNSWQYSGSECNTAPTAFPFAQEYESPYLFFVSMDDELNYHLNVMKLGHINASVCLYDIPEPPIAMCVCASRLYVAYTNHVSVYNVASPYHPVFIRDYTRTSDIVDSSIRGITVDIETSRVWLGHEFGITELTGATPTKYGASVFVNSTPSQMKQKFCSIQASNNTLTWVSEDSESTKYMGSRVESYGTVFNAVTSNYMHFKNEDISGRENKSRQQGSYFYRNICGLAPRSNGDVVVVYAGSDAGQVPVVCVFTVRLLGRNTSYNSIASAGFGEIDSHLHDQTKVPGAIYLLPLLRINDHKYVTGIVFPRFDDPNTQAYEESTDTLSLHSGTDMAPKQMIFFIDDQAKMVRHRPNYLFCRELLSSSDEFTLMHTEPMNFPDGAPSLVPHNNANIHVSGTMSALRSFGIIRYARGYGILFAGLYNQAATNLCYNWDSVSSSWVPRPADRVIGKPMHTDFQAVDPGLAIKFDAAQTYTPNTVYRVDAFPTSVTQKPSVYGAHAQTYTDQIMVPSDGVYHVIDADSTDFQSLDASTMTCRIGNNDLVIITSGTPGPNQVLVREVQGSFVFNSQQYNAVANVSYMVVRDSVGGQSW